MGDRKSAPRCVSVCRDGTQCGRRVTDGSNPPVCHIHAGRSKSPIISDEVDEVKILKRLARDANPQVRLRAVDLLLSLKEKDRDKPTAQRQPPFYVDALTDDERTRLGALMQQYKAFQQEVWARDPSQRPDWAPALALSEAGT